MTIIVADLGTNWDPDRWEDSIAYAIETAAGCGVDYVKMQDWGPIDDLQRPDEDKNKMRPWTLDEEIIEHAQIVAGECKVGFFCSLFTESARVRTHYFKYAYQKIATSENANYDLLRMLAPQRPALISFDTRPGIFNAFQWLICAATVNSWTEFIPMACVPLYHKITPEMAIAAIQTGLPMFKQQFARAGWSSHVHYPECIKAAQLAVNVFGADFVEVHFNAVPVEGAPDNGPWALGPDELAEFVEALRE